MEKEKKIGEWKELMVKELTEKIKQKPNFYVSNYTGLKADEINNLRRLLEPFSSKYLVVKNSIVKIALKNVGFDQLTGLISGDTGMIIGGDDLVAATKAMAKFSKSHNSLKLRGGYIDGEIVDDARISHIASLPTRGELIAKAVYGIKSPLSGFVGVLSNTLRSFVYVLQAVKNNMDAK